MYIYIYVCISVLYVLYIIYVNIYIDIDIYYIIFMYIIYIGRYPEILGRSCFKKIGKTIVSRSLFHQNLMGIPDVAVIYKTLYGDLMV